VRETLEQLVAEGMTPGAIVAVSVDGERREPVAVGSLGTIGADGAELIDLEPVTADTRYDLASVTKLYSAVTALRLVDAGILDLDAPVVGLLPQFVDPSVTLRHLLTHTSGLPPTWDGWRTRPDITRSDAIGAITSLPLMAPPGAAYEYSCLGYITTMALAETATRRPWDDLVQELVLDPLGLAATGFTPVGENIAPTEYQPEIGRGLVRGIVHDETAASLGGVSANAGLFATVGDLLSFGEAMNSGFAGLLERETAAAFAGDQLADILSSTSTPPAWGQGLGPRIGQASWMTAQLPDAIGHNGFTGPSVLADPSSGLVVAFLTNRVHPSRTTSDGNAIRLAVHEAVLTSL